MSASDRWRRRLLAWAIPDEIRARAPQRDPWGLSVASFVAHAQAVTGDRPADRLGREALGDGGSVLDVGCGGGAATVGLGDAVRHATGVDERADMLAAFSEVMRERGVDHEVVVGRWPDVSDAVPEADVVVSHHVAYNVADLDAYLVSLDARADRRVVLELSSVHPRAWTTPYWQAIHGLDRPDGPTVDDLVAVAVEVGISAEVEVDVRPSMAPEDRDRRLDHLTAHLCLRDDERDRLAEVDDEVWPIADREVAAVWWDRRD